VWEKIQAKITAAGAQNPPMAKKISAWARKQGLAGGAAEQFGNAKPMFYGLANKLVFSKVREKLGLDRCRMARHVGCADLAGYAGVLLVARPAAVTKSSA